MVCILDDLQDNSSNLGLNFWFNLKKNDVQYLFSYDNVYFLTPIHF